MEVLESPNSDCVRISFQLSSDTQTTGLVVLQPTSFLERLYYLPAC